MWYCVSISIGKHRISNGLEFHMTSYQNRYYLLVVMAHTSVENQSKLSPNSVLHYYVGSAPHTKQGILLYNPNTKQVIIRRSYQQLNNKDQELPTLQLQIHSPTSTETTNFNSTPNIKPLTIIHHPSSKSPESLELLDDPVQSTMQSPLVPDSTMATQDITPDQIVHLSDIPELLVHNTRTDSHQVSTTNDLLQQLPKIYPTDVLTARNEINTGIEQSVPPGTPQTVSPYSAPTKTPNMSTSRGVPTITPGKSTIPSMLDIVNAGYQRRLKNKHIAHIANRYHCFVSVDESDNHDNREPTPSTSDSPLE